MTKRQIKYKRLLKSLGRNKNVVYLVRKVHYFKTIKEKVPISNYTFKEKFFSLFKKQTNLSSGYYYYRK